MPPRIAGVPKMGLRSSSISVISYIIQCFSIIFFSFHLN
jgi:hypothetical protein